MDQNIVIIKAINRKGRIFENANVKATDPDDPERSVTIGQYKGNRLPSVVYGHRPWWRESLHAFASTLSEEDFNKLVPSCNLIDTATGQKIERADFRNRRDPFLTHPQFMEMDTEGRTDLNLNNPKDKLLLSCLEALPIYHKADSGKPIMSSMVKYEIIRPEALDKRSSDDLDKKQKCFNYLSNLDDAKKVKIGIILKLRVSENSESRVVNNELLRAIDDNYEIGNTKIQDKFIQLCDMDSIDFENEFLVANAFKRGHLKKTSEGFLLFGNPIARNINGVFKYIKDPDNFEQVERLQQSFKLKQ